MDRILKDSNFSKNSPTEIAYNNPVPKTIYPCALGNGMNKTLLTER